MSKNLKKSQPKVSKVKARGDFISRRDFLGGRFTPTSDPPSTEQNPWNRLTIVAVNSAVSTSWEIRTSTIADRIVSQLDSTVKANLTIFKDPSVPLDIKVKSIESWNIEGKSIALAAYNLLADHENQDIICDAVDTKSEDSYPRVGYRWPLQMQQVVMSNNISKPQKVAFIFAPSGSDLLVHIHVMWKTSITPSSPYNKLCLDRQLLNVATTSNRLLRQSNATSKAISDWLPTKLINAVPVVLEAVDAQQSTSCDRSDLDEHPSSITDFDLIHHSEVDALRQEVCSLRLQVQRAVSVCGSQSSQN